MRSSVLLQVLFDRVTAEPPLPALTDMALFLLPGGRPRRLGVVTSAIHDGGRPRRRPRPRANRSRLTMASSICSRSDFNSTRILVTSIFLAPPARPRPVLPPRLEIYVETLLLTPAYSDFHPNVLDFQVNILN